MSNNDDMIFNVSANISAATKNLDAILSKIKAVDDAMRKIDAAASRVNASGGMTGGGSSGAPVAARAVAAEMSTAIEATRLQMIKKAHQMAREFALSMQGQDMGVGFTTDRGRFIVADKAKYKIAIQQAMQTMGVSLQKQVQKATEQVVKSTVTGMTKQVQAAVGEVLSANDIQRDLLTRSVVHVKGALDAASSGDVPSRARNLDELGNIAKQVSKGNKEKIGKFIKSLNVKLLNDSVILKTEAEKMLSGFQNEIAIASDAITKGDAMSAVNRNVDYSRVVEAGGGGVNRGKAGKINVSKDIYSARYKEGLRLRKLMERGDAEVNASHPDIAFSEKIDSLYANGQLNRSSLHSATGIHSKGSRTQRTAADSFLNEQFGIRGSSSRAPQVGGGGIASQSIVMDMSATNTLLARIATYTQTTAMLLKRGVNITGVTKGTSAGTLGGEMKEAVREGTKKASVEMGGGKLTKLGPATAGRNKNDIEDEREEINLTKKAAERIRTRNLVNRELVGRNLAVTGPDGSPLIDKMGGYINASTTYRTNNRLTNESYNKRGNEAVAAMRREKGGEPVIENAFRRGLLWAGVSTGIYGAVSAAQMFLSTMIKMDKQVADLRKTLVGTDDDFKNLVDGAISIARVYKGTTQDVLDAMEIFSKQFKNAGDLELLSKAALIFSNISGQTLKDSAETMTATIEQYNLSVSGALHVTDAWASVAASSAVTIKDLGDAVSGVGSVADTVGIKFDELNGLIAAVSTSTGKSGKEIGNAFKRMFERATSPENQKELEKNGVFTMTKNKDGEIVNRNFMDILTDVQGRWDKLSDTQRKNISIAMVGARQYDVFIALMRNWSSAMRAAGDSVNSFGEAERQNERIGDTFSKKVQQLGVEFDNLARSTGSYVLPVFGKMIESLGVLIKLFNDAPKSIQMMGAALAAIGAGKFAGKFLFDQFGSIVDPTSGNRMLRRGSSIGNLISGNGEFYDQTTDKIMWGKRISHGLQQVGNKNTGGMIGGAMSMAGGAMGMGSSAISLAVGLATVTAALVALGSVAYATYKIWDEFRDKTKDIFEQIYTKVDTAQKDARESSKYEAQMDMLLKKRNDEIKNNGSISSETEQETVNMLRDLVKNKEYIKPQISDKYSVVLTSNGEKVVGLTKQTNDLLTEIKGVLEIDRKNKERTATKEGLVNSQLTSTGSEDVAGLFHKNSKLGKIVANKINDPLITGFIEKAYEQMSISGKQMSMDELLGNESIQKYMKEKSIVSTRSGLGVKNGNFVSVFDKSKFDSINYFDDIEKYKEQVKDLAIKNLLRQIGEINSNAKLSKNQKKTAIESAVQVTKNYLSYKDSNNDGTSFYGNMFGNTGVKSKLDIPLNMDPRAYQAGIGVGSGAGRSKYKYLQSDIPRIDLELQQSLTYNEMRNNARMGGFFGGGGRLKNMQSAYQAAAEKNRSSLNEAWGPEEEAALRKRDLEYKQIKALFDKQTELGSLKQKDIYVDDDKLTITKETVVKAGELLELEQKRKYEIKQTNEEVQKMLDDISNYLEMMSDMQDAMKSPTQGLMTSILTRPYGDDPLGQGQRDADMRYLQKQYDREVEVQRRNGTSNTAEGRNALKSITDEMKKMNHEQEQLNRKTNVWKNTLESIGNNAINKLTGKASDMMFESVFGAATSGLESVVGLPGGNVEQQQLECLRQIAINTMATATKQTDLTVAAKDQAKLTEDSKKEASKNAKLSMGAMATSAIMSAVVGASVGAAMTAGAGKTGGKGAAGGAIGGLVGTVIGAYVGGTAGASVGGSLGGVAGGFIGSSFDDPIKALEKDLPELTDSITILTSTIEKNTKTINDVMETLINAPSNFVLPIAKGIMENSISAQSALAIPLQAGGYITKSGRAFLHAGESVISASDNSSGGGGLNVGGITINSQTGNPQEIANEVINQLNKAYAYQGQRTGNYVRRF